MQDQAAADRSSVTIAEIDTTKVAELRSELERLHKNDIVKDLWKKTEDRLRQTHYYWWWRFVHAGAKQKSITDELEAESKKADAFRSVIVDFDLAHDNFDEWWADRGRGLFQENTVPHIDPLGVKVVEKDGFATPIVFMAVPLSITKELLVEQFKLVVDAYFPENFMRHAASTAERKIEPSQKDREFNYEYLLAVWTLRTDNPNMPFWKVHCQAIGNTAMETELEAADSASAERSSATRKAQQAYKQADELMRNALIGCFPKDGEFQQKKRGEKSREKKKSKKAKQY